MLHFVEDWFCQHQLAASRANELQCICEQLLFGWGKPFSELLDENISPNIETEMAGHTFKILDQLRLCSETEKNRVYRGGSAVKGSLLFARIAQSFMQYNLNC